MCCLTNLHYQEEIWWIISSIMEAHCPDDNSQDRCPMFCSVAVSLPTGSNDRFTNATSKKRHDEDCTHSPLLWSPLWSWHSSTHLPYCLQLQTNQFTPIAVRNIWANIMGIIAHLKWNLAKCSNSNLIKCDSRICVCILGNVFDRKLVLNNKNERGHRALAKRLLL